MFFPRDADIRTWCQESNLCHTCAAFIKAPRHVTNLMVLAGAISNLRRKLTGCCPSAKVDLNYSNPFPMLWPLETLWFSIGFVYCGGWDYKISQPDLAQRFQPWASVYCNFYNQLCLNRRWFGQGAQKAMAAARTRVQATGAGGFSVSHSGHTEWPQLSASNWALRAPSSQIFDLTIVLKMDENDWYVYVKEKRKSTIVVYILL